MGNRSKRRQTAGDRRSFLRRLLDRAAAHLASGESARAGEELYMFMEELESRELMSAAPVATPETLFSPQRSMLLVLPHCQPLVTLLMMTAGPQSVPRPNTTQCFPTSLVAV